MQASGTHEAKFQNRPQQRLNGQFSPPPTASTNNRTWFDVGFAPTSSRVELLYSEVDSTKSDVYSLVRCVPAQIRPWKYQKTT